MLAPAVLMASLAVPLEAGAWQEINDGVMGGESTSRMREEAGTLVFEGRLSLENGGGFASARRPLEGLPDGASQVRLEIRGDGRRYQFRIRLDAQFDGVAWSRSFGTTGDWQTVELPLADFQAVFRGRPVKGAGPVVNGRVRQVGFMLADRKPGAFRLEIRSIEFPGGPAAAK